MKQKDLIDFFMNCETKLSGQDCNQVALANAWNLSQAMISLYISGTKEIPTWRIAWCMIRYNLNPGVICGMLKEIYTPAILKKCYKNKAFSAELVTL